MTKNVPCAKAHNMNNCKTLPLAQPRPQKHRFFASLPASIIPPATQKTLVRRAVDVVLLALFNISRESVSFPSQVDPFSASGSLWSVNGSNITVPAVGRLVTDRAVQMEDDLDRSVVPCHGAVVFNSDAVAINRTIDLKWGAGAIAISACHDGILRKQVAQHVVWGVMSKFLFLGVRLSLVEGDDLRLQALELPLFG